jgi:Ca2+-binding RTX toxin-like protein
MILYQMKFVVPLNKSIFNLRGEVKIMSQSKGLAFGNGSSLVFNLSGIGEMLIAPDVPTIVIGGSGDDTIVLLANDSQQNVALGNGGDDIVIVSPESLDYQYEPVQNLIRGGAGEDTVLTDGFTINTIEGGAGDDHFFLGGWLDRVEGGEGRDTFSFIFGSEENPDSNIIGLDFTGGDVLDFSYLPECSHICWDGEDYISVQNGDYYMGITIPNLGDQVTVLGGVDALVHQGLVLF